MMFILNLLAAAGRNFAEWRRRERAYGELMALDDRALADIGIRRSQIRALVESDARGEREAAAGAPSDADFWRAQGRLNGLSTRPNL